LPSSSSAEDSDCFQRLVEHIAATSAFSSVCRANVAPKGATTIDAAERLTTVLNRNNHRTEVKMAGDFNITRHFS
jgi:hypothetical protein